jgi:integrase
MARLKGLEPLTRSLEGCRSNPLSYRRSDFQTIQEVPELLTLLSKYCESRSRELAPRTERYYRTFLPLVAGLRAERMAIAGVLKRTTERAPVHGNRLFQLIKAGCRWGVAEGLLAADPTHGMRKLTKEHPRERILTDGELRAFMVGLEGESPKTRAALLLLVLLGQRLNETLHLAHADLHDTPSGAVWKMPRELHKGRRGHLVPLPPFALSIIRALPKKGSPLVLGGGANPSRLRSRATRAMEHAGMPNLPRWTLHDLRRTVASGCARLGTPPHVVEHLLGHAVPTLRQTYNLWSHIPEMRAALERWEAHVLAL